MRTPRCLIFLSVCAAGGTAASARPMAAAAADRSNLCMGHPLEVKLVETLAGKQGACQRRLDFKRPSLPGIGGCSTEHKSKGSPGGDVARAPLHKLRCNPGT